VSQVIHGSEKFAGVRSFLDSLFTFNSFARSALSEAWTACMIAGSSLEEAQRLQDIGLWDHPLCDPKTAGGGCMWLPIGPWAKGRNVANNFLKCINQLFCD
jgi:hypothetical protein